MNFVVELDGARICLAVAQRPEFRVAMSERCDAGCDGQVSVFCFEVGMALSTRLIAHVSQTRCPLVLHVARGARRRERLPGVVHGTVVAGRARLIRYSFREHRLLSVAGVAFQAEARVSRSNGSTGVNTFIASKSVPSKPKNTHACKDDGQDAAPTRDRIDVFEIVPVDALRQLFCCPRSSSQSPPQNQYRKAMTA